MLTFTYARIILNKKKSCKEEFEAVFWMRANYPDADSCRLMSMTQCCLDGISAMQHVETLSGLFITLALFWGIRDILPLSQWTCKRPLLPVGDILIHKQKMMVAWVPRQAHKHTHTHTHTQVLVWWGERVWTCCILHSSVLSLLAAALLVSLSIPAYLPVNLDLFSLLRAPAPPPLLSSLLIAIDQSVCSTKFRAGSG